MRKRKQLSGGKRMYAAGRRPVAVALHREQMERAVRAAAIERRSLANLFVHYGMQAVERILNGGK